MTTLDLIRKKLRSDPSFKTPHQQPRPPLPLLAELLTYPLSQFNSREQEFIQQIAASTAPLSEKQHLWLKRIAIRVLS